MKLLCALLLLAGTAWAGNEPDSKWHECKADADCIVIGTGCMNNSVNKKHEKAYRKWAVEREATLDCPKPSSNGPKFTATCKKGVCDLGL